MIVEIRRYEIVPGRREEFEEFFANEILPAMTSVGMKILGQFVSIEDDSTFYFLRSFDDAVQRAEQTAAFYESAAWLDDLKERALEMETGARIDVVEPAQGSAIA